MVSDGAKLMLSQFFDATVLQAFYRFKILQAIPIAGGISYAEVSKSCGINEDILRRLARRAMTFGFLREIDDRLHHTDTSALARDGPNTLDMIGFYSEFNYPSSVKIVDTLEKQPMPEEPNATAFNSAFGTDELLHRYVGRDDVRNRMFSGMMKFSASNSGLAYEFIIQGHPWGEYGEATVVDVRLKYTRTLRSANIR